MASTDATFGVDIGGTATRLVAIRPDRTALYSLTVGTPDDSAAAVDGIGDAITTLLENATERHGPLRLTGIGIGASGPIDNDGVIQNPDTLPALTGAPLVESLRARFGVEVRIDNDAVTAAIAEDLIGAGTDHDGVLVVTLGTGVGVAMIRHGRPYRGGDGVHPEAGHITVPDPPMVCYCGRETCFEQTGSRAALQKAAHVVTGSADLKALAASDDAAAQTVFDDYGTRIGEGLTELATQYRPTLIVLGGSAAAYLPRFHHTMDIVLDRMTTAPRPAVVATNLGDTAGALGAALLLSTHTVPA
jgi:glucokinase